nr:alanine--tRNA ligase-like isoform X2 [Aegilops tauschii subsp. strangulata]
MRGKGAAADVVQEALPTCGCHIERYRRHDAVPRRRPVRVDDGEGTSAAGAAEAVRTCGSYTDTPPRRPTPVSASTALGIKGGRGARGQKNKRDELRVEVSRGGVPMDGFEESVARCGFRNPSLVRRCPTPPRMDSTRCAQMGACIPVAVGGGRGHKDTHDDYYGTSRPRAAELHVPTADLRTEMYETGSIEGPSGSFTVNNVQVKFAGDVPHTGSFLEGPDSKALSVGDEVKCKDAFVLSDTYGYPIDLTEVMAVDFGPSVDMKGFNVSMEEARQKARNARYKAAGKSIVLDANATSHLRNQGLASINASPKFQHEVHSTVVKAIYTGSEFIATASGDEDFGLVLESTSFYAEQGGQIYDTGSIEGPSGSFTVNNVQVFAGYVLHIGSFLEGPDSKALSVGDEVKCKVTFFTD